jgi:hypothetical protein
MTNAEILSYMKLRYDAFASQDAPGYDDQDYSTLFNSAQKIFEKSLYNEYGNISRKGAEETEKRSKDLSELKDHAVITAPFSSGDHPNSFFVNLPDLFWVALKEECDVTYTDSCNNQVTARIQVKPVKEDYYNVNVKNPYKRPYEELVWRIDRERGNTTAPLSVSNRKRHEIVLFQGAQLVNYRISYYRRAKDVDLTDNTDYCEFDPIHHERIADMAVELGMQTTEKASLQTKIIENSKIIE